MDVYFKVSLTPQKYLQFSDEEIKFSSPWTGLWIACLGTWLDSGIGDKGSVSISPYQVRMSGGEVEGGSLLWIMRSRGSFDTKFVVLFFSRLGCGHDGGRVSLGENFWSVFDVLAWLYLCLAIGEGGM